MYETSARGLNSYSGCFPYYRRLVRPSSQTITSWPLLDLWRLCVMERGGSCGGP